MAVPRPGGYAGTAVARERELKEGRDYKPRRRSVRTVRVGLRRGGRSKFKNVSRMFCTIDFSVRRTRRKYFGWRRTARNGCRPSPRLWL